MSTGEIRVEEIEEYEFRKYFFNGKSFGSRHAAHTAQALRWRIEQLLKCLIKKRTLLLILCFISSLESINKYKAEEIMLIEVKLNAFEVDSRTMDDPL